MSVINSQSAENMIMNNCSYPAKSFTESATRCYDDNNAEQRNSLLHSLAQNPQMMSDFHQFLESTRTRSAQQFSQPNYNGQMNQGQQQIPSFLDRRTNIQHQSSTPKRVRTLNESGGSISSAPKQLKPNEYNAMQRNDGVTTDDQQHQRKPLPFDQLKRAVSSNLPCFFIEFEQSNTSNRIPSALEARDIIEKHLEEQNVHIQHFTLVGWVNKQLKLGVNNKEDYMTLANTDKWPVTVKNIPVKIIKPKFIPDCFTLVVRYVPRKIEPDSVIEEIQRTISSAVNIKQIRYAYERKTNDFRFTVKDLIEYNSALKLGRIAINNHWLSVTQFLSGNRMTYCTRCWKIGHRREQCRSNSNRCRICLNEISNREEHQCSNQAKCAQCGEDHHSLDGQCREIQQYRAYLKEDVTKALESGKLHRHEFNNQQQQVFMLKDQEFPPSDEANRPQQPAWVRKQTQAHSNETSDSTKTLLLINENLIAMRESNRRVEEKLEKIDSKLNQTALDTELHQRTIVNLIEYLQSLIHNTIWPITNQVNASLLNVNPKTSLQSLFDKLGDLKSNVCKDYEIRRKRAASPPVTTKSSATSEKMNSEETLTDQ